MPNRFDEELEQLKRADLSPSDRLAKLADTVTRMAEELKRTAEQLAAEERRHRALPIKEERRAHPR